MMIYPMMYPKTKEDWITLCVDNWHNLYKIIGMYNINNTVKAALLFREEKWKDLATILNQTWENAPDSPHIYKIPAWGILCDLCSERYLLDKKKSEE